MTMNGEIRAGSIYFGYPNDNIEDFEIEKAVLTGMIRELNCYNEMTLSQTFNEEPILKKVGIDAANCKCINCSTGLNERLRPDSENVFSFESKGKGRSKF